MPGNKTDVGRSRESLPLLFYRHNTDLSIYTANRTALCMTLDHGKHRTHVVLSLLTRRFICLKEKVMRLLPSCIRITLVPLFVISISIFVLQHYQSVALSALMTPSVDLPQGGFVADGGAVGDASQAIVTPSLAIRPGSIEPWVAVVQNNRIVVNQFMTTTGIATGTWQQVDGILNRGSANPAANPSLDFAGADRATAWVAWRETVDNLHLLNAAFFNGSNWTLTPLLNRDTTHNADHPVLTAGSVVSGVGALPWVAWEELDINGIQQIVVSQAEANSSAQGGFRWLPVGDPLNVAAQRNGNRPDLAFAGDGNTTPWVVWGESGGDRASRIFARRLVGGSWQLVGRQENCGSSEVTCTLNLDVAQNATTVRIAAGALPNESVPSPWVVFVQASPTAVAEIRVLRLDIGDIANLNDDRFVPVGGPVNTQCLGNAGITGLNGVMPDIVFVGNVPHVTWVEQQSERSVLYVCHLADTRSGLERWDLDSITGINTMTSATAPSLAANGTTPYVAWQENSTPSSVHVAHRYPPGPAWATNFPANLNVIASLRLTPAEVAAIAAELGEALNVQSATTGQTFLRSQSVNLTTMASHVNGAGKLEEIWLQLTDKGNSSEANPRFLVRYVVAENKVYVQDPDQPGIFLPGVTPGAGSPNLFTRFVTLETPKVRVISHGTNSPTVDVQWSLIFEDAAFFQSYDQSVKIVYSGGQDTGFFKVGTVMVGGGGYLPIIFQDSSAPAGNSK